MKFVPREYQTIAARYIRDNRRCALWAEMGLGNDWKAALADPTANPARIAPPTEVLERFLERTAEQRPSVLASLGLSTLQAMSLSRAEVTAGEAATATPNRCPAVRRMRCVMVAYILIRNP